MSAPAAVSAPPRYEPFGWHHWPDHFFMSYQFRRGLGETQEGGGAVSECFQAASRMIPGDLDSWHEEWLRVADRNDRRGDGAERAGHIRTAMNCWLRAVDYFRSAEFWLAPDDPRRLPTFTRCEAANQKWLRHLDPPGEVVEIPYEGSKTLPAYFIKSPAYENAGGMRQPVLISFGGLDSFKDELWFMTGRGAVQRGIAVLLVDGPGQGGALRRQKIVSRHDYEVGSGRGTGERPKTRRARRRQCMEGACVVAHVMESCGLDLLSEVRDVANHLAESRLDRRLFARMRPRP